MFDGLCHLHSFVSTTDAERVAFGGLPFPGTGCPEPDVANIYLIWNV